METIFATVLRKLPDEAYETLEWLHGDVNNPFSSEDTKATMRNNCLFFLRGLRIAGLITAEEDDMLFTYVCEY